MAHYLAEQMELARAAPSGEAGDGIRRRCADLILRIWEHREDAPIRAPLKELAPKLAELVDPKPCVHRSPVDTTQPFQDLIQQLEALHQEELQLCLRGWIADLDLTTERDYLRNHAGHLSDDERRLSEQLVAHQDALSGPDAKVGQDACPFFTELEEPRRLDWVRTRLREIAARRAAIIGTET
jgi:hypothetical protein